jgi:predicted enzyme related to lactoylglutathione lyase
MLQESVNFMRWSQPLQLPRLLGPLVCLLSLTWAAPLPAALPPLVQPSSDEHHVGKVIWLELVTPNLAAAEQFYGGLFGWTFQDIRTPSISYALALLNGRPVCGIYQHVIPPGEHRQPAWLTFIAVRDVDASQQLIVQQRGQMLAAPHTYPQRGRQAVFTDPQGAVFAILASSSGDPPDVLAAPGEWIWSSLIAREPDTDAAFYQNVFGYEVFDSTQDSESAEHLILATDDYARASVNALPDDLARRHAHWLNFVRVTDTEQMAAKVAQLGGHVLVEPRVDRHGGKVAVVADFSGAPFCLLEWVEGQSKEATQ